ncbi:MAG: tRNA pseudouridine(38-40) synthase TruA [Pseudohongiellaceae bacterium]|nr:tRNA pseudouridine(38-40) synthase TruA [Pseudohongiellaceae bacterium]
MTSSDIDSPNTSRIALAVEYDGAAFHGWQSQADPELPTVQASVERALSKVANHPVNTVCAGRTDTGVHGCAQVVHFDCQIDRGEKAWVQGCNSQMPKGVRILWAKTVDKDFHARFSATARRYNYVIYDAPVAPALLAKQLTHTRLELNVAAMHEAGQYLLGEHDFSSFRAAGCQSRSPFRNVMHLRVTRHHRFIVIDIRANAFLQHMVRNIAGVLLEIGAGRKPPEWAKEVLSLRDRTQSAMTASPCGLYLVDVSYPESCGLPQVAAAPSFLQPFT